MTVDVNLTVDNLNLDVLAKHHVVKELVSEGTTLQSRVKLLDVIDVTLGQVNRVTTSAEVHVAVENPHGDVAVHIGPQVGLVGKDVEQGCQHQNALRVKMVNVNVVLVL